MPKLNPQTLRLMMEQRGFTQAELATRAKLSPSTIGKALRGESMSASVQTALARVFGVEPAALLIREQNGVGEETNWIRDISGVWKGTAQDVIVPGHIEYEIEPVTYTMEMNITQTDSTFCSHGELIGQEGTAQPFEANGHLKEEGNYAVFEWWNCDLKVNDYGIGVLEYTAEGKWLEGYFVGRERIHGPKLIFGNIRLSREVHRVGNEPLV